jgi:hypothetical protein
VTERLRTLPDRHGKRVLIALAIILALGFGLRARRALVDPIEHPGIDSLTYAGIARSLYHHQTYGVDQVQATDWSPGAPLLYAGTYYLMAGERPAGARLLVALMGTLTIFIVYLLARRIAGRGPPGSEGDPRAGAAAGLAAAAITALYPYFVFDAGRLMSEPLGELALVSALLSFLWALDSRNPWAFLLPGALLGVTALARPEYLIFGPIFAAIALVLIGRAVARRPGLAAAGLVLAGFLIPVLPWLVRDYVILDRVVPISTGGGKALFIGTYLPGDGNHFKTKVILYRRFHPKVRISDERILKKSMVPLLNRVAGRYPDLPRDTALAKIGRENFREYAVHHPLKYGGMLARKVRRMWSPSGRSMRGFPKVFLHCLLLALGIAGLVLLIVRRRIEALILGVVLLGITVTGALLLAGTRRNVVLMPVVITLAGCALSVVWVRLSSAGDGAPDTRVDTP